MSSESASTERVQVVPRGIYFGLYVCAGMLTFMCTLMFRALPSSTLSLFFRWRLAFVFALFIGAILCVVWRLSMRLAWERLFACFAIVGLWLLCLLFLPWPWSLGVAAVATLLLAFPRPVFLQNFLWMIGTIGVVMEISGWVSAEGLIVGLVLCTLYDMFAVERVLGMMQQTISWFGRIGVVPGMMIPTQTRRLKDDVSLSDVSPLLLTSQLVLPLSLVARAAFASPWWGVVVCVGMLSSFFFVPRGVISASQDVCPLIAVGVIVSFCMLRVFSVV